MSNSNRNRNRNGNQPGEVPVLLAVGAICGLMALIIPIGHFPFALVSIILVTQGIKALAGNMHEDSQYLKYKDLIIAILCFIFGSVSSLFNIFGVFAMIRFIADLVHNQKRVIPPTPGQARGSARTSTAQTGFERNTNREGKGYYSNNASSSSSYSGSETTSNAAWYGADSTSSTNNKFSRINNEDIIQQAKNFMQNKTVNMSKATREPAVAYQSALTALQKDIDELDAREESVAQFLDDFFAGSTVSKSRYLQTIKNAHSRLETNYEKASQAVKLFGNSEPTQERMDILNRYVEDSREIMQKVEKVINELITVQQNDVISDGNVLDELLDDLASTTAYYQRSPYTSQSDSWNANSAGNGSSSSSSPSSGAQAAQTQSR